MDNKINECLELLEKVIVIYMFEVSEENMDSKIKYDETIVALKLLRNDNKH